MAYKQYHWRLLVAYHALNFNKNYTKKRRESRCSCLVTNVWAEVQSFIRNSHTVKRHYHTVWHIFATVSCELWRLWLIFKQTKPIISCCFVVYNIMADANWMWCILRLCCSLIMWLLHCICLCWKLAALYTLRKLWKINSVIKLLVSWTEANSKSTKVYQEQQQLRKQTMCR